MKLREKIVKMFFPLILLSVFAPFSPAEGAMSDYCVVPPFLPQPVQPNVLVILDNSLSMACEAYATTYAPAQFVNGQYYGYFDGLKNYRYTGSVWEETTASLWTGTVANPIAKGSFLNWATMRRVEVAKKLLIGGKGNPRSPSAGQTVKLDGEATTYCNSFDKDFDNTSSLGLIYPFTGNYRYRRTGGDLEITYLGNGSENVRPTSDITSGAWVPNSGTTKYTQVDETTADTGTVLTNKTTNVNDQVILGYQPYTPTVSGPITSVTIKIRARKYGNSTMGIQGVVRMKIGGVDVDYVGTGQNLSTSFADYNFTWALNPATGLAWDYADFTTSGVNSLVGFGVKAANTAPTTSLYPSVTQIYMVVTVNNPAGGPYNVTVDWGDTPARGIIDTLTSDVRFGLAYYNTDDQGAKVDMDVKFLTTGNMNSMITSIGNMAPATYTPLGESLYEMIKYFRQDENADYNPSPAYHNTDYSTGLNYDPYYYKFQDLDASFNDRYVPCAKSFVLMLTDGESTRDQNIPPTTIIPSWPYSACTLTNIRGCSGYGGSPNNPNPRFATTPVGQTYTSAGTGLNEGRDYLIDVAYWAKTNDMRPGTCSGVPTDHQQCLPGTQNINLYPVYMFGSGSTLLKDASIYGAFNDMNDNKKPDCTTNLAECYRDSNLDGIISTTVGACSNSTTTACTTNANCTAPGICKFDYPISYYEGEDGYALEDALLDAISDILRRVTSGTAASVLASGEGSGANLIQATYYPQRQFGSDKINWIGSMQNLWYYVDPFFTNSNIREEGGTKDYILNLQADGLTNTTKDYVLQLYFDSTDQKAKAHRFTDPDGNGVIGTQLADIEFEKLGNLWNAGTLLWKRNIYLSPRSIKTWIDKNSNGRFDTGEYIDFSLAGYTALTAADKTIFKTSLQAATDGAAYKTIHYVNGYDKFCTGTSNPCLSDANCLTPTPVTCSGTGFRSRTVAMDLNGDGDVLDTDEGAKVWKLGDIINSTPQIATWKNLNRYHLIKPDGYKDGTYDNFINDNGSTLAANSPLRYKNRGMVFVGANDGMLHAFKLGKLNLKWGSQTATQKGTLGKYCVDSPATACAVAADCPSGACANDTELGKEMWAFIPKNVLPYLDYLRDPDYCHLYTVDLPPFIFDASIEGPDTTCTETTNYWKCAKNTASWRTILIGGMRYGGGCKPTDYPGGATAGVEVPVTGEGYSSYFALDITNPEAPQLLWEFSNPDLGFATSGPAVLKIRSRTAGPTASTPDLNTDGRWFVVFGSGPTGGIDVSDKQFLGNSDQNLKLFILDLKTGAIARTIDTGIANAYAGSMLNTIVDGDRDYQDNVVYIPYVRKCVTGDTACDGAAGKWNNGGVLRLLTNEDLEALDVNNGIALNPDNWKYSKVIDDAGPVTSSVANLVKRSSGKVWIYFGAGRYYYKLSTAIDDASDMRYLYGLKDPCFLDSDTFATCLAGTAQIYTPGDLEPVDLTTAAGVPDSDATKGWKISMDGCQTVSHSDVGCSEPTAYYRTERVITNPLTTVLGHVFFTTLTPYDDICSSGGNTALWALAAETGGAIGNELEGKALIQVSTGAIEQVDLSSAFTQKSGRKTLAIQGVPPTSQGMSLQTQPLAVQRVLHSRER